MEEARERRNKSRREDKERMVRRRIGRGEETNYEEKKKGI